MCVACTSTTTGTTKKVAQMLFPLLLANFSLMKVCSASSFVQKHHQAKRNQWCTWMMIYIIIYSWKMSKVMLHWLIERTLLWCDSLQYFSYHHFWVPSKVCSSAAPHNFRKLFLHSMYKYFEFKRYSSTLPKTGTFWTPQNCQFGIWHACTCTWCKWYAKFHF